MKLLFVNLPSVPTGAQQITSMPMGILYLSAYVKKYTEYEVKMLDIHEPVDPDWIPDVVAYSVIFSSSHGHFIERSQILRQVFPNATHIAGGNHATNAYEEVGKHVDHVFLGEGELALVQCLKTGFPSKYIKSELMDITEILQPDWELLDMDRYINAENRAMETDKKSATIITSRGCPFKCTFCAGWTVHGRKLRQRSLGNVIEEVKALHERYGVNLFIIEDDLFLAPKSRGLELLKRFRELEIPGFELRLPSALSVKVLSEDLIDALIMTGTRVFNIAIESGSEKTQEAIQKCVPLDKAKRLVKYIREQEIDGVPIVARCYFMLGFPGETREDMQETIRYAIDIRCDWARFACVTPLIGSEFYEQHLQYLPNNIWEGTHFNRRTYDTPEISGAELSYQVKHAHNAVNYLNNPYLREGRTAMGIACLLKYSQIYTDQKVELTLTMRNNKMAYRVGTKKGDENG